MLFSYLNLRSAISERIQFTPVHNQCPSKLILCIFPHEPIQIGIPARGLTGIPEDLLILLLYNQGSIPTSGPGPILPRISPHS